MLSVCAVNVCAADENIKVIIDIKNVKFDVPPTIVNGRTLVPVRAISEAFGFAVGWDGDNNLVSILSDTDTFTMLYAKGSRSKVFAKSNAESKASQGWYTYPVTAVYSADGKETIVATTDVDTYLNDGYYAYPVKTVYRADGTAVVIAAGEYNAYIANGYLKEKPVVKVESEDGTAFDYSEYAGKTEEELAILTVASYVKNFNDPETTYIYSVYAGYYEGQFLVVADIKNSTKKRPRGTAVLRLEPNSTVSNLYGDIGAVAEGRSLNIMWAAPLIDQKTTLFKPYNSDAVREDILKMAYGN